MTLPQVNATVVKVTAGVSGLGGRDDFDEARAGLASGSPADPVGGADKWVGEQEAYLTDEAVDTDGAGGPTVTKRRTLVVPSSWAREVGVDTDDVLHIEHDGGVTVEATAKLVAIREWPAGRAPRVQTARLDLAIE